MLIKLNGSNVRTWHGPPVAGPVIPKEWCNLAISLAKKKKEEEAAATERRTRNLCNPPRRDLISPFPNLSKVVARKRRRVRLKSRLSKAVLRIRSIPNVICHSKRIARLASRILIPGKKKGLTNRQLDKWQSSLSILDDQLHACGIVIHRMILDSDFLP